LHTTELVALVQEVLATYLESLDTVTQLPFRFNRRSMRGRVKIIKQPLLFPLFVLGGLVAGSLLNSLPHGIFAEPPPKDGEQPLGLGRPEGTRYIEHCSIFAWWTAADGHVVLTSWTPKFSCCLLRQLRELLS
jgi:hypothetical protein